MPDHHALMMKAIAVIITGFRPTLSAMLPAKKAPAAQPSSMEATLKPVPTASESKACCSASTVPLITPLSKPNRKPPIAATTEMNRTRAMLPAPSIATWFAWFISTPFVGLLLARIHIRSVDRQRKKLLGENRSNARRKRRKYKPRIFRFPLRSDSIPPRAAGLRCSAAAAPGKTGAGSSLGTACGLPGQSMDETSVRLRGVILVRVLPTEFVMRQLPAFRLFDLGCARAGTPAGCVIACLVVSES